MGLLATSARNGRLSFRMPGRCRWAIRACDSLAFWLPAIYGNRHRLSRVENSVLRCALGGQRNEVQLPALHLLPDLDSRHLNEIFFETLKGKGLNELNKYRLELISRGIAAGEIPDETFYGHHLFCIMDPDGNGITIYTSHAI
jgi:hypothetical protein